MSKNSPENINRDEEQQYITLFTTERIEDYVALSLVLIILIIVLVFY